MSEGHASSDPAWTQRWLKALRERYEKLLVGV